MHVMQLCPGGQVRVALLLIFASAVTALSYQTSNSE